MAVFKEIMLRCVFQHNVGRKTLNLTTAKSKKPSGGIARIKVVSSGRAQKSVPGMI